MSTGNPSDLLSLDEVNEWLGRLQDEGKVLLIELPRPDRWAKENYKWRRQTINDWLKRCPM